MKQTFKRKAKAILVLTLAAIGLILACLNFTGCCCCCPASGGGLTDDYDDGYYYYNYADVGESNNIA